MTSRRQEKKKGTKRVFLPIAGLLDTVAAPFIGEIVKPIFKKIDGRKEGEDD